MLFPNVLVSEALNIIETRLRNDPTLYKWTCLSPANVMEVLHLVVDNTIFTFRGNLYQQSLGFPMGSPTSPGECNTFCEKFEEEAPLYLVLVHR